MNIDEVFRHFFGFSNNPHFYRDQFGDFHHDDEDEFMDGDPREFGTGEFHSDPFTSPLGIMRHFEEMFRNFGLAEFFPVDPRMQQMEPPAAEENSPRERMLKEGGGNHAPNFHKPWFKGVFERPDKDRPPREDSDLDAQVSESGMGALISPRPQVERHTQYFSSSVSIRSIRGADEKMEEHRTVRDSSGKEETTVRRAVGNESHSVTTIRDSEGLKEKREDFVNLDEGRLAEFNKKWENQRYPMLGDNFLSAIFKRLFGIVSPRSNN